MKAVVLETRGKKAAVLVKDGTVRIVRGRYDVGDIIDFNEAPHATLRYWATAAAAAIAAIGLTTGLWIDRNYITYAEVSLDVNPSIVYSVNKRDRVLSVKAANEDAEGIVDQLEQDGIRFTPLCDVVDKTMEVLEDEGFLSENNDDYVLINVSADDDTRQSRLVEEVESAMKQTKGHNSTLEYHIDRSDRSTAREAKENGMSTGRYAAWKDAKDNAGPDELPSMEDFSDKPVREIVGNGAEANQPTGTPDNGLMEPSGQQEPHPQGQPDGPNDSNRPSDNQPVGAGDPEHHPADEEQPIDPLFSVGQPGDPPFAATEHPTAAVQPDQSPITEQDEQPSTGQSNDKPPAEQHSTATDQPVGAEQPAEQSTAEKQRDMDQASIADSFQERQPEQTGPESGNDRKEAPGSKQSPATGNKQEKSPSTGSNKQGSSDGRGGPTGETGSPRQP